MNHLILEALAIALLAVGVLAGSGQQHQQDDLTTFELADQSEWEAYKLEWAKHYDNPTEEAQARANYAKNRRYIEKFNRSRNQTGHTFSLRLNQFSDMDSPEVHGQQLPGDIARAASQQFEQNSPEAQRFIERILANVGLNDIPKEVDWSKDPSRVSSVKEQGKCRSGWAFATAGVLEGQEKMQVNKSLDKVIEVSAQNLIDCGWTRIGCMVGFVHMGLYQVRTLGGVLADSDDPYVAKDMRECHFDKSKSVIGTRGPGFLPTLDADKLLAMVAKYGPVAVQIDGKSPSLLHYAGGVFNDGACGDADPTLYHAALLVGYGTDPKGGDYWLVKNSWGSKWGEQGYVRIARNDGNICGIETKPTIATY